MATKDVVIVKTGAGRFGVLESLAVLPNMRNRGVGRRLISGVYEELRGLGVTVLEIGVLATNEDARRFYERQGFAPWVIHYLGAIPGPGRSGRGRGRWPSKARCSVLRSSPSTS